MLHKNADSEYEANGNLYKFLVEVVKKTIHRISRKTNV